MSPSAFKRLNIPVIDKRSVTGEVVSTSHLIINDGLFSKPLDGLMYLYLKRVVHRVLQTPNG